MEPGYLADLHQVVEVEAALSVNGRFQRSSKVICFNCTGLAWQAKVLEKRLMPMEGGYHEDSMPALPQTTSDIGNIAGAKCMFRLSWVECR